MSDVVAAGGADETVALLRESIERYTADNYSFEQRWTALRGARRYSERAWCDYAAMGWLALRLPEDSGGLAAGATAVAALMEAVGARLMLEPILASVILCTGLVLKRASESQRSELLPRLADGTLRLALAHQESLRADAPTSCACEYRRGVLTGNKVAVLHGDCADRLIVSANNVDAGGELSLFLVDAAAPGVACRAFSLLDGRGAANFSFAGAAAQAFAPAAPDADAAALAECLEEAAVALCSEAFGVIRVLNAATLQYLKARKQFGRAIGSNQALQHRMVEMYMLEQEVRALILAAQRALQEGAAGRARIISGARAFTCGAARYIAAEAVQMHGGIGITDEVDVSHYYRRAQVLGTLFGNRDFHLARFGVKPTSSLS
jgi:alkylation response protein AidB-like acyl-CoA dehydrogenase